MTLTYSKIEEIECITSDLLKECYGNIGIVPPINLNLLIKSQNLIIKLGMFKEPDIDGVYDRNKKTIFLSIKSSRERQVFTAAHELGHHILHSHKSNEIFRRENTPPTDVTQKPEEAEANWFAASLLMPRELVLQLGGSEGVPNIIAKRFGVSAAAAYYRLKNLGFIVEKNDQ